MGKSYDLSKLAPLLDEYRERYARLDPPRVLLAPQPTVRDTEHAMQLVREMHDKHPEIVMYGDYITMHVERSEVPHEKVVEAFARTMRTVLEATIANGGDTVQLTEPDLFRTWHREYQGTSVRSPDDEE